MLAERGRLTALGVGKLKKPGKYYDGFCGLFVQVYPTGAKCWQQRVTARGVRRSLGLGGFPTTMLAAARTAASANWSIARNGGNPHPPKEDSQRETQRQVPTFAEAANKILERDAPTWKDPKYKKDWMRSMRQYVLPSLGSRLVSEITRSDVLDILEDIWTEQPKQARLMRQRIRTIMGWAMAREYCAEHPAASTIDLGLPRSVFVEQQHYPAVPYAEVPAALAAVRSSDASPLLKLVFQFIVLTAVRSGEARGARWSEIDFDKALWTLPAKRMKAKRTHEVPLSTRAIETLREAEVHKNGSGLVFPGVCGDEPFHSDSVASLARSLQLPGTVHGFRSSFRDWAAERVPDSSDSADKALAHVNKDRTTRAYYRTVLVSSRAVLMQRWSDFVMSTMPAE